MSIGDERAIAHIREIVEGPENVKKAHLRGLVGLVVGKRKGVVYLTKLEAAGRIEQPRPAEGSEISSPVKVTE